MTQFVGIAFPFTKSETSYPAQAVDNELVRQSLLQILATGRGERVMRPDFGADVHKYLFDSLDTGLEDLVSTEVRAAIGKYEPRVAVQSVQVDRGDTSLVVTVTYVVLATKKQTTLSLTLER